MNYQTISETFSQATSGIHVEAILFTTYNLEVSFFETEIIPLLFNDVSVFSNDVRIKELQVREKLESTKLSIDLFYDQGMFEQERQSSNKSIPSMEYGFFGVNHANGAFHPKVILVLGTNSSGEKELILFAGSNNLTKSGWWDNIETINFITLSKTQLPTQQILTTLHTLTSYLAKDNTLIKQSAAMSKIKNFLNNLNTSNKYYADTYFYFSLNNHFPAFIEEHVGKKYKTTEIVSPYFPDNEHSKLHEDINASGNIYLPFDIQDGVNVALCTETHYAYMQENGFIWSDFKDNIDNELHSDNRSLHAKLFLFGSKKQKWVFSGSVNFTYKAFHDNIEAGFLFKVPDNTSLLKKRKEEVEHFLPKNINDENGKKRENKHETFFEGQMLFDWSVNQKKLLIFGDLSSNDTCYIKSHTGEILLSLNKNLTSYDIDESDLIVKHLEKNAYIVLSCKEKIKEVYVQQINWIFKPLDYPELTLEEIIGIYSAMDQKKRDRYIMSALIRKIVNSGEETEYTRSIEEIPEVKSFFSEYAELFYAFRRVDDVCQIEPKRIEYYLFAERPDSISSLLIQLEKDEKSDNVLKYLILLSARELYKKYGYSFKKYKHILKNVKNTFEDKKFLKWFEDEFDKTYKQKAPDEA